jgi:predicted transposase YdaD
VLTLPPELEEAFREDLETYERGKNMPYISAIEKMGEARGEARGEAKGKVEGKVELIGLLLAHQVGMISAETAEEIKKLPIEQLDRLALDLRDFTSVIDLTNWLQQKN